MHRYFAIFIGLNPAAPWGVAVERTAGFPKVELLLLCRTEADATQLATLTSLGHGLKSYRDEQVTESESRGVKVAT